MADIRAFAAIRPRAGLEARIAALPYDVYNTQEARKIVQEEPLSFLKIDRAETAFAEKEGVGCYEDRVYRAAHDMLWERIEKGDFVQDEKACYYLYSLTMNGRSQTGIVACASIDDYLSNRIKKHENTREDKEIDRICHVDVCDAQTGPIFLAYRSDKTLKEVTEQVQKETPVYDFVSGDGIRHKVWVISDAAKAKTIKNAFGAMDSIYIADGHHRCASAVKVGLKRRDENPSYTGEEAFNYFLSVLFPDDELRILDYNRVITDLNGLNGQEFLDKITEGFLITEKGEIPYRPDKKGCFGMYLDGIWYELCAKKELLSEDPVDGLDVSVLQNHLLAPVLGIGDPKSDKRIDFVGGIRGLKELERRVNADMKVAFSMYPTSIQELFAVADANALMPPKSTWFEPKLRSGLFIHSIRQEDSHDK